MTGNWYGNIIRLENDGNEYTIYTKNASKCKNCEVSVYYKENDKWRAYDYANSEIDIIMVYQNVRIQ